MPSKYGGLALQTDLNCKMRHKVLATGVGLKQKIGQFSPEN
jgi:hypothetical protein